MTHRYPFDDDEDSSILDSFELLDDGREPATERDDFGEEGVDGIPLLEDVVDAGEDLRGGFAHGPRDPGSAFGPEAGSSPGALDDLDRERLAVAVRQRLESELGQVIAAAVDEALRPAVLDLETQLRGELFDTLRQRISELIEQVIDER